VEFYKLFRLRLPSRIILFTVLIAVVLALCIIGIMIITTSKPPVDGILPDEVYGVSVYTVLLPLELQARPGYKRDIRYIVVHETANYFVGADAKSHSEYLLSGRSGTTSWHYTVDDHEIYHNIPDDEVAWHASDKLTEKGGNSCGIGIELCVNEDGDFEQTLINGAKLTAYLLNAYGLNISAVTQHADYTEKNCPKIIRDTGRWQEFLGLVESYLNLNKK